MEILSIRLMRKVKNPRLRMSRLEERDRGRDKDEIRSMKKGPNVVSEE